MAVFRVERNKGYTVMSNHHLRNKELSLKAKGLLSQMLSLPEDWDYTLKGLSLINREKIDAIREAIKELERAGYIVRSRERDEKGRLRGADYVIFEQPQPPTPDLPTLENPTLDNPTQEKPTLEKPTLENPTQLNKDIQRTDLPKKEKIITDEQSTHSIPILSPNPSPCREAATPPERKGTEAAAQSAVDIYREIIKDNIDYHILKQDMKFDGDRLDEIVDLMLETVCTARKRVRIAGDDYPAELVKSKFMKLDGEHIRFVLDCMRENTTKIRNIKQYLKAALFNAPSTIGNYYTSLVAHDMASGALSPKKPQYGDENFDKLTIAMLNEFIEKILVHERDRKGSIQTTQEVEIYFNFVGRFVPPAFGEAELTPEELEEIRKREERKDRLHQNYLKRKASGAQKRYEDKIKGRKKAEIEAKKAAIRAEDIAKGVFVPVSSLPQREPMKGVQTA